MISRRKFLQTSMIGGAFAVALPTLANTGSTFVLAPELAAFARPAFVPQRGETLITVLHTNDQHSQIDPLPANDKNANMGGVARRATLVKAIRKENPNTLLLDAGDAFQGTPYFNLYKGEVEYKAMSSIGYDVVTLGNHDFDNGVEALFNAMKFADFEFVSANYDVSSTVLAERVKPYTIRNLSGVRVGIFGLGIKLAGLNPPESFARIKYLDPVGMACGVVKHLREKERCQLVLCASHLGYYPSGNNSEGGGEPGDSQVAERVEGIDLIASGHTHTFMKEPAIVKYPSGRETLIFQVGKSGIYVGRVDFLINKNKVVAHAGRVLDLGRSRLVG